MSNKQSEFELQTAVCDYLNRVYPNAPFESSVINLRLTIPQGKRMKRISDDNFKPLDMKIFVAAKGFHGLILELKTETPFKKNCEIKASQNDHLRKQFNSIIHLKTNGYHADFYWTFESVKKTLDWYLS